ncbi:OLC1v1036808C1 [Oldenlandia corymbosa var. corymbosa]|uniref:tRNA-uridine aminocarboxypropyltransferase n=1 Tax=Oldenlandia corymbosa var. corymbosa TaxID=529605 RepID=A0AAV1CZE2_OLDCO|nr:OLC1v1036808C1 [Oldenlandia corymbosa var. corymbosa]
MDLVEEEEECAATTTAATDYQSRRRFCERGCERPVNVCLCGVIPETPIPTVTKVLILHHPHEKRHKLATVPVLKKCLESCEIIVGRKLRYGDSKVLDSLYDIAAQNPDSPPRAIYLFPGKDASPLTEIKNWKSSSDDDIDTRHFVLIVFDGTWKHAKEMLQASSLFLSKFAVQACLEYDDKIDGGTIYESDLTLRKEPFSGCMSTMEAVARCLRLLEPNGTEVESRLIEVLSTMVKFQASYLMKPIKHRPRLRKKSKEDAGNSVV